MIKHKFKAKPCEADGKKFPSQLEKRYYEQLVLRQKAGDILFFLRQVPLDLPGNVSYRCDFVIFKKDGEVEFVDCKGFMTPLSDLKIKQVQSLYPIEINLVMKA